MDPGEHLVIQATDGGAAACFGRFSDLIRDTTNNCRLSFLPLCRSRRLFVLFECARQENIHTRGV